MSFNRSLAGSVMLVLVGYSPAAFAQSQELRWPSASARYRDAAGAQTSYYEARRVAHERGFREGLKEGEKDARKGDRFEFRDEKEFRRADRGYHRSFGDRERYRQVFRDGYADGYSEGYSRTSRYGHGDDRWDPYGRGPYVQRGPYGAGAPYRGPGAGPYARYPGRGYATPAYENGLREGFEKGREDADKNRSFDPLRHSWYRSGDRHYEREYGAREDYKDLYRQGFRQGYEQGFREGRYRW